MNRYGKMARDHWARWLPACYAQIPDSESFFTALGREVEQQIGTWRWTWRGTARRARTTRPGYGA